MSLSDSPPRVLLAPKYDPLVVHSNQPKEILRIHSDGRITVTEDAKPTDTARQVLEAMSSMIQWMLKSEYERGYKAGLTGVKDE